jgi:predicted HicB family RNase H-like nuclease
MAKEPEPWTQLATRISKQLHRRLKLYCVHADMSVMEFVATALKEKLARQGRGARRMREEGTT